MNMIKYPRTSSGNSSGFFDDDDDDPMYAYQTPPQSPGPTCSPALASQCLQHHIVRMFSTEDASGTSAVAIDNKIEQAMDLVKSHLMIAVREEVEVLKEKISELMDKINQLEVENTILKANMSQETLQQLQMQTQLQIAGSTPTNGSNMIAGAPTQAAIAAAPTTVAAAAGPPPTAATAVANAAVNANSNSSTAAATPQSNVGSGTATPTAQQPATAATTVDQSMEATQLTNVAANTDDSQGSVQTTNGPMS